MKNIPFALPETGEEEISEVSDTIRSGWLTTGPKVKQFEKAFRSYIGVDHALAVNSGTAGLHLALEAIGVKKGDTVITTPYTFTATAEVIRYLGAEPIFVDIDPRTFNIDPQKIERIITKLGSSRSHVKAILPVHFAGQACDMFAIKNIAEVHNLRIIEDAAHALPTTFNNEIIGKIGDATVFSFYVTKTLAIGEGGMVTTNIEAIANRIKVMRLHGINRDIWDRYRADKPNWYYEVIEPGFKYNMSDVSAAIGIHQLNKLERFQKRRDWIAQEYNKAFKELPLKIPFISNSDDIHSWHLYVIQLEIEKIKISRNQFIDKMIEFGIGTSVHFIPLHLHPYWRKRYGFKPDDFPVANICFKRAVSLPIYSKMSDEDVGQVIKAVKKILG